MKTTSVLSVLSFTSFVAGAPGAAAADATLHEEAEVPAVEHALEIGLGGTVNASLDASGDGAMSVPDLSGAGGASELEVAYRVTPHLTLGVYGLFEAYGSSDDGDDRTFVGLTAGLQAGWHVRPASRIDPWLTVGAGGRSLRIDDDRAAEDDDLVGIELARLQLGVDYRVTPAISIGPVLGASASMFLAHDDGMTDGFDEIDDKAVNWTITTGLRARLAL